MADIAQVRKRIQKAIEQARRDAADRRARVHDAQRTTTNSSKRAPSRRSDPWRWS